MNITRMRGKAAIMDSFDITKIWIGLGQLLFALLAACAKWLNVKTKKRQRTLLAEAVAAAVAGGMVFFANLWLDFNIYLGFILAGFFGFLGVKGIEMIGQFAARSAGLPDKDKKEDK